MKIIGLYSGKSSVIGPIHSPTGIFKQPKKTVLVGKLGIEGDVQADTRFHGGPEKALHQYALSSYEKIIKAFPLLHRKAWPGSIGENISIADMHDRTVCIGDIYQIGEIKVQVSSPRIPCWKIDEKIGQPGLHNFVAMKQITGWYYRVLEGGEMKISDNVSLVEQYNSFLSISNFMQIVNGEISDANIIQRAAQAQGLDPMWSARLQKML